MILWFNFFTQKVHSNKAKHTHTQGNGMAMVYDDDDHQINFFWKKKINSN